MTDVIVAGGGPTGLMLGAELTLAGVDVQVLERRPSQVLVGSRAGGLHARTIEVLDQRGIADRFLAEGQTAQVARFNTTVLDISDFPTRHPYGLGLWQNHIERLLGEWLRQLGVPVRYGHEVTGVEQDDESVEVRLADGRTLRAQYVVGCDGGRSAVRKAAGIDFPGWDPTISTLVAEIEVAEEPEWGLTRWDDIGVHGFTLIDGGLARVVTTERTLSESGDASLRDLSAALTAAWGTDYGVHSPVWISRFTDAARQATSYRRGRILLAGDAAHVHSPTGGQGLNIGVQDAVNLGWKLAQVVAGTAPDTLLDTYHAERHPVAARVLKMTLAQVALFRPNERTKALGDTVTELLNLEEPRKWYAGFLSGLDIHYHLGDGHPLLGRRMPDLDLTTADGPQRMYPLLHQARPVLLDLDLSSELDITPWAARVRHVRAGCDGAWTLPVVGAVPAPKAALIRPDGYVAWVGNGTATGLLEALRTWFGPPA
jgi:3-(3-hydroxy-phenyl)propionate hydroxylase